jgi:hypothetical protein
MHDRKHGDVCPECGEALDTRPKIPDGIRYSSKSIVFLMLGILTLPFAGLLLSLIFVGVGAVYSSKILRKTTYRSASFSLHKRLKIISVLMWIYGIEIVVLIVLNYALYFATS